MELIGTSVARLELIAGVVIFNVRPIAVDRDFCFDWNIFGGFPMIESSLITFMADMMSFNIHPMSNLRNAALRR